MKYDFKKLQELGWAAGTAVAIVVLNAAVTLDFAKVTDWRVWAIGLAGASVRAAAGALLAKIPPDAGA